MTMVNCCLNNLECVLVVKIMLCCLKNIPAKTRMNNHLQTCNIVQINSLIIDGVKLRRLTYKSV